MIADNGQYNSQRGKTDAGVPRDENNGAAQKRPMEIDPDERLKYEPQPNSDRNTSDGKPVPAYRDESRTSFQVLLRLRLRHFEARRPVRLFLTEFSRPATGCAATAR